MMEPTTQFYRDAVRALRVEETGAMPWSTRPRRHLERGFTLIELMLVISILGLMATMASPSFFSMRDRARYASCVLKQRQIHEISILYGAEKAPGTTTVQVALLTADDYITPAAAECPSSNVKNFDDFEISFIDSAVDALVCEVMGVDHLYTP